MLLLLPPSETKRDGGTEASALDVSGLAYPSLNARRRAAIAALRKLSRNREAAASGLKIGPSLHFEIDRNRAVTTSAVMPAMDRYTGVLYDALDAATLNTDARAFLSAHVVIASALFGLIAAGDGIPAYRLSHNSRLPELALKAHWRDSIQGVLAGYDGLILDLRSESYVGLGPAPVRHNSYFLRVVGEGDDGVSRALNHFNKKGKGEFVRRIAEAGIDHGSVESLLAWAERSGVRLRPGNAGELNLVV